MPDMDEKPAMFFDWLMDKLNEELETFQWSYGMDRSNNRGEIYVDREEHRLVLEVWTADNDQDENGDDTLKPLNVSVPITTYPEPREQIRNLIHLYLCHEADEQIWFGDERPYYPHQDNDGS
jgi:hypothetical protein